MASATLTYSIRDFESVKAELARLQAVEAANARMKTALIAGRTMMEGNDAPEYDRETSGVTVELWDHQYDAFKDALAEIADLLDDPKDGGE